MNISASRSGGFSGVTQNLGIVRTSLLDDKLAHQIEQLVHSINFFDLPATISSEIGTDLFRYEITIMENDRQHTVTFQGDESPEIAPLRQLVEFLIQHNFLHSDISGNSVGNRD